MKSLMILALLLLLTACTDRSDDDIFIWDESVENPFYGETLTVAVMYRDPMWRFINLFEQDNPGVEIELIVLGTDFEAVRERLGVQLMAGESPMLMESFFVNMRNLGMFVDWMPLMEAHPSFNDDEWFMDAFHTLAVDGRLFAFPTTFVYRSNSGNINVPGLVDLLRQMDSITKQEIIEIYHAFGGLDSGLHMASTDIGKSVWFSEEFVDFETGFVNFTSPAFLGLLEMASEIMKPVPDSVLDEFTRTGGWDDLSANYYMFDIGHFCHVRGSDILYGDMDFSGRLPLVSEDGELFIIPSMYQRWVLSAAATKTQRALALDFIRFTQDVTDIRIRSIFDGREYLIGGEVQINRARFDHCLRRDMDSSLRGVTRHRDLRMSIDDTLDYLIDQVKRELDRPMVAEPIVPEGIVAFLNGILDDLNLGIVSPHEAATALQNRVMLEILEGN